MHIFNKYLILLLSLLVTSNIYALTLDKSITNTIKDSNEAIGFSIAEDNYWLIQDGYATTDKTTCPSSKTMGYYQIIVSGCSKPNDAKDIAVNERTGNIVVLTGQLVIKLKTFNDQALATLENENNLTINNKFSHLNLVFATADDIITVSKDMAKNDNIDSVRIDLIKRILTLN